MTYEPFLFLFFLLSCYGKGVVKVLTKDESNLLGHFHFGEFPQAVFAARVDLNTSNICLSFFVNWASTVVPTLNLRSLLRDDQLVICFCRNFRLALYSCWKTLRAVSATKIDLGIFVSGRLRGVNAST